MDSDFSIPTPKIQYYCSRDDHLRVQTLYWNTGFTKDQIALQLNLSIHQVKYTLTYQLTPQKQRSGWRPFLRPAEQQ
ncbi:transposable element tc3 protein [Rutstroemia sp. NJR-2017a WRK4]|nr:transposable element tc3 protein [Rutstroemia sp. NJR-2017a WRK4]